MTRAKVENYNAWGRTLYTLLQDRGLKVSDFVRLLHEVGFNEATTANISWAMLYNKKISTHLLESSVMALRETEKGLLAEEEGRLRDAAQRTSIEYAERRRRELEEKQQNENKGGEGNSN